MSTQVLKFIKYNIKVEEGRQPSMVPDERIRNQVHELFQDKYEVLKNSMGPENDS